MLNLPLTVAEQRLYHEGLSKTHRVKTVVQILDTQHNVLGDVSSMLLDGQVDGEVVEVDPRQDLAEVDDTSVLHTLNMSLMDPRHLLQFDSHTPADGAVYLDRMIRVYYCTFMPAMGRWVDCPIFTGPISDLDRPDNGYQVNIVAKSKDDLACGDADVAKTFKGQKVDICRDLLKLTGELDTYIDFPAVVAPAPKDVVLVRESKPWPKVYALGASMSRNPFYDGRGVARMADLGGKVVFTFNGDNLTNFPSSNPSTDDLFTGVRVRAGTTSGSKSSIDVTVYADEILLDNPNSGTRLGRNGVKRNKILLIDDPDIKTKAAAITRATTEMTDKLRTVNKIGVESFCIPHLELWDLTDIVLPNFYAELRVKSFSKPIRVGSRMTAGYNANVSSPSLSKIGRT